MAITPYDHPDVIARRATLRQRSASKPGTKPTLNAFKKKASTKRRHRTRKTARRTSGTDIENVGPNGGRERDEDPENVPENPCQCDICPKIFTRVQDVKRHKADVHGISELKSPCPESGCVFRWTRLYQSSNLRNHLIRVHKMEVDAVCGKCGRYWGPGQQVASKLHKESCKGFEPTPQPAPATLPESYRFTCGRFKTQFSPDDTATLPLQPASWEAESADSGDDSAAERSATDVHMLQ